MATRRSTAARQRDAAPGPRQRAGLTKQQRSRAEVVRAAKKLFHDPGYDDTTVDDLARDAGTSVATLYNLFPGKGAIAGAVFGELFEPLATWAERADGDPLADLIEFGRRLARLAHSQYEYTTALLQAVQTATIATQGTRPEELPANDPRNLAPVPVPAVRLIERCQKSKQIRGDLPARELGPLYTNTLLLRVMTRRHQGPKKIASDVNTVMIEGMRRRPGRQRKIL